MQAPVVTVKRIVVPLCAGVAALAVSGCATGFIESPATNVTATSATLNGSVGSNRSEAGVYWFEYGKTAAYGSTTAQRTITFVSNVKQPVAEPISGLTGGTDYHYRLCAKDNDPQTGAHCSADAKFSTSAAQITLGPDRPRYLLHIDASDGSPTDPQSGAAEVTISVDGNQVYAKQPGCATQNCSLTDDWAFNADSYTPGHHTVTVRVKDAVGRTTSRDLAIDIQRDTTKPDLTVSGPLKSAPEGWVDQHNYTVTGDATDSGYGVTSLKLVIDDQQVGQPATQPCPDGACSLNNTFTVNTANYSGGAHDVKLVATDGAGNSTTNSWTMNVNPGGHIPTSEATSTLQAADATSGGGTVAPTSQVIDPAEIADGNKPGLQQSGTTLKSTGTPAASTMTTNPADGFTIQAPDAAIHVAPTQTSSSATAAGVTSNVAAVSGDTSNNVDSVVRPIFDGVESFQSIRDATAPESFSWQVTLAAGQTLESVDDQTAEVYYADRTPAMMISAQPANDATGTTVPTKLSASGDVITLTVSHRNGKFVYPITAGPGWETGYRSPFQSSTGPPFGDNRDLFYAANVSSKVDAPVLDRATGAHHSSAHAEYCQKISCSYWDVQLGAQWYWNGKRHVPGSGYAWRDNGTVWCRGSSHPLVGLSVTDWNWSGPSKALYGYGNHLTIYCNFEVDLYGPVLYNTYRMEDHLYGDGYQGRHLIHTGGDVWIPDL